MRFDDPLVAAATAGDETAFVALVDRITRGGRLRFERTRAASHATRPPGKDYDQSVARSLIARIHNPSGRECGCAPECWCRRSAVGRAVRWYLPLRHHAVSPEWKRAQERDA